MARKHKRSGGSCKVTTIRFKTRRGKVVEFEGRPGGMTTAGGECKPKHRSTAHLRPFKLAMKKAAKACKGKSRGAFRKCVGAKIG